MGGLPTQNGPGNANNAALLAMQMRPATGYAEPREADATLAIFDSFTPTGGSVSVLGGGSNLRPVHGQVVEGIMRRAGYGDRDIQNFQTGGSNPTGMALFASRDPKEMDSLIDRHLQELQLGTYNDTTANLRLILDDPKSRLKTINQSQSLTQANLTEDILAQRNLPGIEPVLREALGVSPTATDRELAEAVMARVQRASSTPEVRAARERYQRTSAEAERRGLSHVIAAGNTGELDTTLRGWGVRPPAGFHRNLLATDHNTTVGASDHSGARPAAARFTSPEGAELSANGVQVPSTPPGTNEEVREDGTSFAAPQVAVATARLRALNPRLTPRQAEDLLRQSAAAVEGEGPRLGAGVIRPPA